MRILTWYNERPSETSAFHAFFVRGHEAAGHQIISLDSQPLIELFGVRGMQRILLHYARAYRVQAVLVLPANFVEPPFLEVLRASGVVTVGLRFDDGILASPGMPLPDPVLWRRFTVLDASCDLTVTICRAAVGVSERYGCPPMSYLPLAYPWQMVAPATEVPEPVIRYCGSPRYAPGAADSYRIQVARSLLASGLPVSFHHDGWREVPGFEGVALKTPSVRTMFDLIRKSAVNLCLPSEFGPVPYPMVKGLNVEIAAAGAMQVTYPSREVTDILGDSVVTADSLDAFVDRARYFVERPGEAFVLGQRSRSAIMARGGWDRWWEEVAELLAAKGLTLDLEASPIQPTPADSHVLYLTAIALAHVFEGQGRADLARPYFVEALRYDPNDYAATAGLARVALGLDAQRAGWRQAFGSVGLTHPILEGLGLPTKVLSRHGTFFAMEALSNWISAAFELGRLDEVVEAVRASMHVQGDVGVQVASELLRRGHAEEAKQCLDILLMADPGNRKALTARSDVNRMQGHVAAARADAEQVAALDQASQTVPIMGLERH